MGIDLHNLNLLAYAQDRGVRFDSTLAIGRQGVFIDPPEFEHHRRIRRSPPLTEPGVPRYFEPLMHQWFGATTADSVDASPYENARFIHDMNLPWPADGPERGRYDAVLDFGCLEHVFDFPVAWRNCVDLCRVGGHVLHALPANNLSGHGFYQFSPELFFNLYQPSRGFELVDLFFAMKADAAHWWRVANPMTVKRRVNLRNSHEVYMLVIARKLADVGALAAPQQSDYAEGDWLQPSPVQGPTIDTPTARSRAVALLHDFGLIAAARSLRERLRVIRHSGFDLPRADYDKLSVDALIARALP